MAKGLSEDQIKWILSLDVSQAEEGTQKLAKQNRELTERNKDLKKSMQQLEAQGKKNSENYKKLSDEYQKNSKQLTSNREMMKGLDRQMGVNNLTMVQLKRRAQDLQNQMNSTSKSLHPKEWKELNQQLNETNTRIGQLKNSGSIIKETFSVKNIAKGALLAGLAAFVSGVKGAMTTLKDFEKANADLAAVLGTTRSNIKPLIDEAKRLGSTTAFTSSQVTSLQTELAKLGFNQTEIIQSTKDVLAFAGATGAELPAAAKLAGAALRMFDLDATEMGRIVSTLAVATTKSALDFTYLETALSTVGPVAKTFGFTIEDTTAMLGTLANSGFDASSAATATRNILLNLADSSGILAQALGGPVKSFDELIPALSLLKSQGVDLATTLELTDKRSVAAFNSFLSGAESTLKLRDSITNCGDALKAMQEEKLNTLTGSLALLSSSWEGLLLKFEKFNGVAKSGIDLLTSLLNSIGNLVEWSFKYTSEIKAASVALFTYIGTLKISFLLKKKHTIASGEAIVASKLENILLKTSTFLITAKNTLVGVLTGKIKMATVAQQMWNTVTSAHPLVALGGAVIGVISYFAIFKTSTDENIESQKQFADSLDETKAAMDRMQGIRLKDANRDTLNPRQLQELRAQSEQELKLKEDFITRETALMRESQKNKEEIMSDEEKMKDKSTLSLFHQYSVEESIHERNIKQAKADVKELQTIVDSIPKQEFTINTDKSDPNQVSLKNMDSAHADELNKIRLHGQEKQKTESEINIEILQSDKDYYTKRIIELEKFKKKEQKSSKQAEYEKQIVESKTKLLNTEVSLEKEAVSAILKARQDELSKEETVTKAQQTVYTSQLANKNITQEQHDALMLSLSMASAEMRLAIEERYLNDVNDLELKNGQIKADAVQQASNAVLTAEQNAVNARAALQTKMNDLVKDFKNQFKLTTVDEDLQMQLKVLEDSYQARKELAENKNLDTTELDAAYYRAKEQIVQSSEDKINQIRNQYGLLNQQEQYNLELQQLKDHLAAKELTQEEYEEAVQNLKIKSTKQQFDYYSNLMGGAVQALQQAEMDNIDAKYDVEIEAAKGNAEEVERLENEKAQKKLDVQKKYADVNFAIEVSQIIANTAVAIMQAFAQLGPIGGAIAAAMMTVTGAAQIASANAERKKVKNMTLSGSNSSGKEKGSRVATGREEGGKIDITRAQDGKFFPDADYDPDARGFIDHPTVIVGEGPTGRSKEWVASNAAVENPTIAPFLQLLDAHQQAGDISTIDLNQIMRQRMAAGYVSGGSISTPVSTPASTPSGNVTNVNTGDSAVMSELLALLMFLKENGIPAYVVLNELEKKQKLRDRARQIGSKS